MKPLLYGYMRVSGDAEDAIIRGLENALKQFAEDKGFRFVSIFYEYDSGSHKAFDRLSETLRQMNAQHVVVPSMGHLSGSHIVSG
ncbi:MAG TPA: recombinase family protein [Pseudonocardiaceae bacterium]|jgi:DNA invertase Pin-like site-specific DNA recombinase|nr:recombinase family protein [Pseudonocardiaceae bacterium]